ncbi:type VI secretion system membrane subunit TssM [Noviherbaspirillum sp. CPCC 100848]|uniref:Type VI secretion system membrane subunit TssM n=1 Tax=Noviherbaspirillum album TaxID=3080276 RepID=A0ABU6J6T7_9BURK|nr:type VI secretion system membrane subunit TssM [Noviherbaspirillum sp. CPCC 100848]MEC4719360.1 type VI secretion system membrane subunit TssM [Noviherbaspirillum sp. CPCC 100848]
MSKLYTLLTSFLSLSIIGTGLAAAAIVIFAAYFQLPLLWTSLLLAIIPISWCIYALVRKIRQHGAGNKIDGLFAQAAEMASRNAAPDRRDDIDMLNKRLLEAVRTIKESKLGHTSGKAALYELPWYIVIGNPAAGKSTAIVHSGLNFPFSDKAGRAVQGIGGTRNCDWFFTTEGILLDTAGRYAIEDEDRSEWFGFLRLLKKYRPKAPVNGIVIVASIAELVSSKPDVTIALAKQLRQRVQELTERLELFVPVYVVFTKMDLVAGFVDFFEDANDDERSRVWGATLPYSADGSANAVSSFDLHFDHLSDGLRELGTTRMSAHRGQSVSPGVLSFPLEFAGLRHHLRSFIATLFEDNPYQFKPIFRGFYFTSAIQEGNAAHSAATRIARQFNLSEGRPLSASIESRTGFFLKHLFSSVIFTDKQLVRQYASRKKLWLRQAVFFGGALGLGLLIASWTWSYHANRQLLSNIQADLDKSVKVQAMQTDLASRLEALEILQDRLEQLQRYRHDKPLSLGFGLYQGERLEHKLRTEYFAGLRQIMLAPVTENLETFLAAAARHAASSAPADPAGHASDRQPADKDAPPESAGQRASAPSTPYAEPSTGNADAVYNALKTYLMLANRDRIDTSHLGDQLTRFWRDWLEANRGNTSREQIIRTAEKLIRFYLAQAGEPDFPIVENKLALVEQVRENLRVTMKGMPARQRVYNEIKMRASTRYPTRTVASIVGDENRRWVAGSHTVSGAFTREAWEKFVSGAIRDASNATLQTADWVLKTAANNDLTLEGSPEQIERDLTRMYKSEYIGEWKKFIRGATVTEFGNLDEAIAALNRLGDTSSSPISTLLQTVHAETSWDNPSLAQQGLQNAGNGVMNWFRTIILRKTPSELHNAVPASPDKAPKIQEGMIGKEFSSIAKLTVLRDNNQNATLVSTYLGHLSKVRSRFNQIRNSGDIGPPSRQLMQATLDGSGSELSDTLRYVEESMLIGMADSERAAVRPLLVRPLMQAFAVIVAPTEVEVNSTWKAQVLDPFQRGLAGKYPFSPQAKVEATPDEISRIFGPDGAIAKYLQSPLGPLVTRRGDLISARTWADIGIRLNPVFTANVGRYVGNPAASGMGAENNATPVTQFRMRPSPATGLSEYTIEIDGQILRYRNGQQDWVNFVWPSPSNQPGARISGLATDGQPVEIRDFPGKFGLEKLIDAARRQKLDNGAFELTWTAGQHSVSVTFSLISDTRGQGPSAGSNHQNGLRGLQLPATVAAAQANSQER